MHLGFGGIEFSGFQGIGDQRVGHPKPYTLKGFRIWARRADLKPLFCVGYLSGYTGCYGVLWVFSIGVFV